MKTCREPNCPTRLSRYNPDDYCFAHTRPVYFPASHYLGFTEPEPRYNTCLDCGRAIPRKRAICRLCHASRRVWQSSEAS